jgi:hypothetical protein
MRTNITYLRKVHCLLTQAHDKETPLKVPLNHASHKEPEKLVCVKGNRYSWTEARKPLFAVVLEPHIVFATCYEATAKHAARETVLRSSQLLENTPCRHHFETWELAIDRPGITGNSNNLGRKKERTNSIQTVNFTLKRFIKQRND